MKVLVTGGAGFIGSAVCEALLRAGHRVRTFQRSQPEPGRTEVEVHSGDVRDIAQVARAVEGCEAVVHTAARAGIWGDRDEFRSINVGGTANVLRACADTGVRYLVYTSSPSVVHTGADIEGADESAPYARRFTAPYPETKAEAEALVLAADCAAFRTLALRPHLVWGPGDPHFLPRLTARRGRVPLGAPDKLIDTTHIDNAAQAHLAALNALAERPAECTGRAYFVTNGEPRPMGTVIRDLVSAVGIEARIRAVPPGLLMRAGALAEGFWRLTGIRSEPPLTRFAAEQLSTAHWFDCSAARRDLGWSPDVTIDEGLARLREALSPT